MESEWTVGLSFLVPRWGHKHLLLELWGEGGMECDRGWEVWSTMAGPVTPSTHDSDDDSYDLHRGSAQWQAVAVFVTVLPSLSSIVRNASTLLMSMSTGSVLFQSMNDHPVVRSRAT